MACMLVLDHIQINQYSGVEQFTQVPHDGGELTAGHLETAIAIEIFCIKGRALLR
jgi:hypothetical protein